MKISSIHKQIDNGGVTIEVNRDDTYKTLSIVFDASYYGYPAVSSILYLYHDLGSDFLKELGLMFLEASAKTKELEEQHGTPKKIIR